MTEIAGYEKWYYFVSVYVLRKLESMLISSFHSYTNLSVLPDFVYQEQNYLKSGKQVKFHEMYPGNICCWS